MFGSAEHRSHQMQILEILILWPNQLMTMNWSLWLISIAMLNLKCLVFGFLLQTKTRKWSILFVLWQWIGRPNFALVDHHKQKPGKHYILQSQESWCTPPPALILTEQKECTSIMAPTICAALPKAGISSSISSVVRHAPIPQSLGLEVVLNLYTAMGTARTSLLLEHCWQKTPTGKLLQVTIEIMSSTCLWSSRQHLNVCLDKLAKTLAIQRIGKTPSIPTTVIVTQRTTVPLIRICQAVIQGTLVTSTFQKSL